MNNLERNYLFVSVPASSKHGVREVKDKLERSKMASVSEFSLPQLRIGE